MLITECRGQVVITPALYSRALGFKSRPENDYPDYRGISQSYQSNAGIVPWPRSLPNTSFPIHHSLIILSFDGI
jgi:hypothetical protein